MMPSYRVMQRTETGEEFCAITGSLRQCSEWVERNAENYPESVFFIESIR